MKPARPTPNHRHARPSCWGRERLHIPARCALLATGLAALAQTGCYFSDEGLSPPPTSLYYPTGLAVSPGGNALYVANSDFDLQYNGGTIQVLDLRKARETLGRMLAGLRCQQGAADACAEYGSAPTSVEEVCNALAVGEKGERLHQNTNSYLTPSACTAMAPPFAARDGLSASLGATFATIGAFASGAVVTKSPAGDKARLFVPVRGDPSITWFDIAPDEDGDPAWLDCGQATLPDNPENRCDDWHKVGVDPYENFRNLTMPVEPVGFDVSDQVGTDPNIDVPMLSTHQIADAPAVGLSVNYWGEFLASDEKTTLKAVPRYQFTLSTGVAAGPMEVAHVPAPRVVATAKIAYQPGFLVTYNATARVDLFRYEDDALASPRRPFVTFAASTNVTANADGKDSRGVVVDDSARKACEAKCGDADLGCQRDCVAYPLDFFVANRAPPSLLIGKLRTTIFETGGVPSGASDQPDIIATVPLSIGPSRVARGSIVGPDGKCATRIFAVSFDTRTIVAYDPVAQRVDTTIETGRGPHAIAFDTAGCDGPSPRSYLYVGHFMDSYLGVVDLDMRHPETYGIMFASIGTPTAPRESK